MTNPTDAEPSLEEMLKRRAWFEAAFKQRHGYEWPDCAVADCENKSCVPSQYCYPHAIQRGEDDPRP